MNASARQQDKPVDIESLMDEMALYEKRLNQLGHDGDCAYEKALVSFYTQRLEECAQVLKTESVSV